MHIAAPKIPMLGRGECDMKSGYLRGGKYFVVKIASGGWKGNAALGLSSNSGVMLVFSQRTGQKKKKKKKKLGIQMLFVGFAPATTSRNMNFFPVFGFFNLASGEGRRVTPHLGFVFFLSSGRKLFSSCFFFFLGELVFVFLFFGWGNAMSLGFFGSFSVGPFCCFYRPPEPRIPQKIKKTKTKNENPKKKKRNALWGAAWRRCTHWTSHCSSRRNCGKVLRTQVQDSCLEWSTPFCHRCDRHRFFCLLLICFWVCIFFWACSQDAANSSHSSLLKFFFCPLFVCHSFLSLLLLLFFISKNYFDFAPCVNSGWIQFRVLVQKNEKKDPSGVGLFFVKTKCNVCVCCLLYVYGFFFN